MTRSVGWELTRASGIVAWSMLVMWIYMSFLGGSAWWLLISFFAITGALWFFPAAWIIRWMAKPD